MFTHNNIIIHLIGYQRADVMAKRRSDSEEGSSDDDCERDINLASLYILEKPDKGYTP